MSLIKSPLEKAKGTVEAATRRRDDFTAERAALAARLETEADFDANFALREDLDRLDRKIAAAEVALASAQEQLAAEQKKAAKVEADRAHADAQKLVPAHEKLIREIVADQQKLAAKLAQAAKLQAAIEAANECSEGRPLIVDGERNLRERPERIEPAVFEDRVVWEDGAGNSPFQFRRNAEGEDVPIEQGFTRKVKPVQVRSERHEFASMPPRLANEIRLVDLAGQQIWPRR